jgi:hypothetical protein
MYLQQVLDIHEYRYKVSHFPLGIFLKRTFLYIYHLSYDMLYERNRVGQADLAIIYENFGYEISL